MFSFPPVGEKGRKVSTYILSSTCSRQTRADSCNYPCLLTSTVSFINLLLCFPPLEPGSCCGLSPSVKMSTLMSAGSQGSGLEAGEELPLSRLHLLNCKRVLHRLLMSMRSYSCIFLWTLQSGIGPQSRGEAHAILVNMLFQSE